MWESFPPGEIVAIGAEKRTGGCGFFWFFFLTNAADCVDEARYVTEMARRFAALLLLGPALDANYEAVKAATYAWPGAGRTNQT